MKDFDNYISELIQLYNELIIGMDSKSDPNQKSSFVYKFIEKHDILDCIKKKNLSKVQYQHTYVVQNEYMF